MVVFIVTDVREISASHRIRISVETTPAAMLLPAIGVLNNRAAMIMSGSYRLQNRWQRHAHSS